MEELAAVKAMKEFWDINQLDNIRCPLGFECQSRYFIRLLETLPVRRLVELQRMDKSSLNYLHSLSQADLEKAKFTEADRQVIAVLNEDNLDWFKNVRDFSNLRKYECYEGPAEPY